MPNFHYQAGRRQEYVVKRKYERAGYWCVRAAGSKGSWDIVALGDTAENRYDVRLIQVKRVKDTAAAKRMIAEFKRTRFSLHPHLYQYVLEIYVTTTREHLTVEL